MEILSLVPYDRDPVYLVRVSKIGILYMEAPEMVEFLLNEGCRARTRMTSVWEEDCDVDQAKLFVMLVQDEGTTQEIA